MKSERFEQFRVIREASAEMLTDRLNRAMYELRHKSPSVEVNGDQALIRYIEEATSSMCEVIFEKLNNKEARICLAD